MSCYQNAISFNSQSLDAFGRLKCSDPQSLLSITQIGHKNNYQIEETIVGGANSTYDVNTSTASLNVFTTGDKITRQSHQYAQYQPGKGLAILMTGVMNSGSNASTTISRLGYHDDQNGFFFEYSGGILYLVERSYKTGSVVDTKIPQSEWNIDKMDGTGISGIELDLTKTLIYYFDFEWLGVGSVRIALVIDGKFHYCHTFHHANYFTTTYITSAVLPLRYEMESTGGAGSMKQVCATAYSDGGFNPVGNTFSVNNGTIVKNTSGTIPLIGLRLDTDDSVPSPNKRSLVLLKRASVISTSNINTLVQIWYCPWTTTPLSGGTTWNTINSISSCEYDVASTTFTSTNCILLNSSYISNNNASIDLDILGEVPFGVNKAGTASDMFVITATLVSGSNKDYVASLTWTESI